MVQVVCQDVDKHAVKMLEQLHRMKQDEDHCDFIVQVGNDVYHAHKNMLSAGSDYFRAMLKHDTKESREGRIVFKDVDSECMKNCIDFIYSSKVEIPDGKNIELLHVAIILQLDDVKRAISDILAESITVDNYFSTRNIAEIYGLVDVALRCRMFLQENIMEIASQAGFGSVEKGDVSSSLKAANRTLLEEEKLELSLKWIKTCEKKDYLHEFLELIECDGIPPAFLQQLLETYPVIRNDSHLYKLITGHLPEFSVEQIERKELMVIFDDYDNCILSLNPRTEKITKFHNEKMASEDRFSMISYRQYIYILCDNKSVHRLDVGRKNAKWQRMEDMICDHGGLPSSVLFCGSIYLIGGSEKLATDNVERFDPSVNQWFPHGNLPTAICDASLVSLNDSIYCIGGETQDGFEVSSFYRFAPSSSEWVILESMRYPTCGCGAVAIDQKIFVTGGLSGGYINNVECYDVTSAQWTSLSSMNFDHGRNTAYHIGNWIFVLDTFDFQLDIIEKYDLVKKRWCSITMEGDQSFGICGSAIVKI